MKSCLVLRSTGSKTGHILRCGTPLLSVLKPDTLRIFALLAPRDWRCLCCGPCMNPIDLIQQFIAATGVKLETIKGIGEATKLTYRFVMDAVSRLMLVDSLTGPQKKELVMKAAGWLFDFFFGAKVLPWYLRWLPWLNLPSDRKSFLETVDRLLEAFYVHTK